MSKKNLTTYYLEKGNGFLALEIPDGYFYKGKFYSLAGLYKELEKEYIIETCYFPNGMWFYKGDNTAYHTLEKVYEEHEEEICLPLSQLRIKKTYLKIGITHNPLNSTWYIYDSQLFQSKEDAIREHCEYVYNPYILETSEILEDIYLDDVSVEERKKYLNKTIKERIKILETFQKGGTKK